MMASTQIVAVVGTLGTLDTTQMHIESESHISHAAIPRDTRFAWTRRRGYERMESGPGQVSIRKFYLLTGGELLVWIVAAGISGVWGYLTRGQVWALGVGVFVNSLNVLASALALGIPIFLAAGLTFSTPASRGYIQELTSGGLGRPKAILLRFLQCSVLVSAYSIVLTVFTFAEPLVSGQMNGGIEGPVFQVYLPSALLAFLVVSTLLQAIAVLLALAADNAVISTVLGSATTMIISGIAGWNADSLSGSVWRIFALLSPHNLFRTLAALLSDYDFASEKQDVMYFGTAISAQGVLVSLLCLSLVALCAMILAGPVLGINMRRWPLLFGMVPSSEVWSPSPAEHDPRRIRNATKGLGLQRIAVTLAVVVLLLSIGLGGLVYTQNIQASSSITHYESPEGGEALPLGAWAIIEFDIPPPYPGLSNLLQYQMLVLDWGSCPDELSYYLSLLPMTSAGFQLLNESSKIGLCSGPINETRGDWGGTGGYDDLGDEHGVHIVVFHVVASENESLSGTLWVSFEVSQRSG